MFERALVRVVAVVLALGSVPTLAQEATPAAAPGAAPADDRYADPAGRFTVPIPTSWHAETRDGYGVLTDPEGLLTVYALTVDETDLPAAIDAAWRTVDPTFAREPLDLQEIPPPAGGERAAVATYDVGDVSGRVVQGLAQLVDGVAYVLLFDVDLLAAQRRGAQLATIQSGFTVVGVERVDLAGVPPATLTPAMLAELETYIADVMARNRVPGAAVAIVQDGRVAYSRGFGVRDLDHPAPVTPDTLMMIGSTTKSMTTMLAATLVDEGRLGWDTPVVELLPGFAVADPALTPTITVRNLFCACTGVPRRDLEFLFNADDLSAQDTVASLRQFEFFTPFGEVFQYSNQMVATGGYAAAAASGAPGDLYDAYETAMRDRVLGPIGMVDSTFSFQSVSADDDHATPHGATFALTYEPVPFQTETILSPVAPAGALWSSATDMTRYLTTQLNRGVAPDGGRVVSAENLAVTRQPQVQVSAETSYGLGWFVDEYKGAPLVHHGGNTVGFTSDLAFLPEAGLGIVTLANAQAANLFTEAVRFRLLELVYGQPFEHDAEVAFALEQAEQAIADLRIDERVDPAAVAPYLGPYANAALGRVTLTQEGDRLILDAGEFRTELRPMLDETGAVARYVTFEAPVTGLPVEFAIENGTPTLVFGEGVAEYRFKPAFPDPPLLSPPA